MQYALINNNKVENIIVADQEFIDDISNQYQHIESLDQPGEHNIGVGWSWSQNGGFSAPANVPETASVHLIIHIEQFALHTRVGQEKY